MRIFLHITKWSSLAALLLFIFALVRLFANDDPVATKLTSAFGTAIGYLVVPCLFLLTFFAANKRLKRANAIEPSVNLGTDLLWIKTLAIISVILSIAFVCAYFMRYETTAVASNGVAYRYDRWTGKTYFLLADKVKLMSDQNDTQRCESVFEDLIPKKN